MEKNSYQILIVEDEPGIVELLRFTLGDAGFSSTIAVNAAEARKAIARHLPEAVLLDWMLPDVAGLTLLREWRSDGRTAALPVIMLTAKSMDEDKVRGLNAGADDYVTKPFSPRELVARIHAVLRRNAPEPVRSTQTHGMIAIDSERHLVTVSNQAVKLDQAEFRLLRFLMMNPERVFSRSQLLDRVWGDDSYIEERTVDVHIMRLRKALGAAADYIKTVRSVGYMLDAMPE
ncbi:two-component system phosphate regulon response regulator PhoB [Actimicrobium sp. GrIS 1.19]|uniref:winged helix-turn-helix domain-containing protein n=1 Tax=Actimicrobium sp. GrIS 1.19 TaxID=3071708 RepID=UPI002E067C93|nr:two-component system phosphate regulon response regulator PhoB [Actimicrobium sp. GrIS 1.19]